MDIQKEREAFEKQGNIRIFVKQCLFDEQLNEYSSKSLHDYTLGFINGAWWAWQAKAQAVPEGYVLVPREMQWHKADDLACLEWGRHVGLFCSENRDISALQVEEFRLRWCKNKANKIMSDYKAMIEAQEPQITELKVEWASDCFKCGHHEAIIYSTAAEASTKGWFHDGDEAKCTGCGNTGEMDAQGEDSGILWNEDEEAAKNA